MTRHHNSLWVALLCLGVLASSGCNQEPPPAPEPAPAQKLAPKVAEQKPAAAKAATTPAATAVEPAAPAKYVYDSAGRRDPFQPLTAKKLPTLEIDPSIPLTPLQKYDLEQFRLVGVVLAKPRPIAMVIAPDGKSYILKKGVKIGKNNGAVIEISADAVIVQEQYMDIGGEIRTNNVEIKLPKKEGV